MTRKSILAALALFGAGVGVSRLRVARNVMIAVVLSLGLDGGFFYLLHQGNQSIPSSSGSGSATSQGPVINVTNPTYAGGASSSNADNNAAFTAAFNAANASVNAGISGQSSIGTPVVASGTCNVCTTLNISISLAANSTTLVFMSDAVSHHV